MVCVMGIDVSLWRRFMDAGDSPEFAGKAANIDILVSLMPL